MGLFSFSSLVLGPENAPGRFAAFHFAYDAQTYNVYVVYRCSSSCRLWYVKDSETETTEDELDRRSDNLVPIEIGYMNVIPKCVDWTGRYPIYENLPETYAAIDAYLSGSPLEGKKEGMKEGRIG